MSTPRITSIFPKGRPSSRKQNKVKQTSDKDDTHASTSSTSQDLTDETQILKHFDLDWKYGPCSGITRLERWDRADKLNLNPPVIVKDLIMKHSSDVQYTHSVWNGYLF